MVKYGKTVVLILSFTPLLHCMDENHEDVATSGSQPSDSVEFSWKSPTGSPGTSSDISDRVYQYRVSLKRDASPQKTAFCWMLCLCCFSRNEGYLEVD